VSSPSRSRLAAWGERHGIWLLFLAVLAGLVVIVAALRWREWTAPDRPDAAVARLVAGPGDREAARFNLCQHKHRDNCVVDGDTIHYHGDKIRIADINTPEISDPGCDRELDLGEAATDRLLALLNEGPFALEPLPDRDTDKYGRKLRTITRGGHSIGMVLVREGLAEKWIGYRRDWCS